jgi:hypothetical protein
VRHRALQKRYGRGRPLNVAYHEAGHAVVAEHLGLHVGRLAKKPKRELTVAASNELATARRTGENTPGTEAEAEKHLICTLAGRLAEEMAGGEPVPAGWHPFDTKDARRFKTLAGAKHLEPFAAKARRLLETHWSEVEAVARMYLNTSRVSGKAIREVIR